MLHKIFYQTKGEQNLKRILDNDYNIRLLLSNLLFFLIGILLFFISEHIKSASLKNITISIASIMLVSGIYNIINEYIIKKSLIDYIIVRVGLKKSVDYTGLQDVILKMNEVDFSNYIISVKKEIDIVHSYGETWTRNYYNIIEEEAEKRELNIRIFLLNPDSLFCESLSNHYDKTCEDMKNRIQKAAKQWYKLKMRLEEKKSSVEIYYFDGNPVHSLYRFDTTMVIILNKINNDYSHRIPTLICRKKEEQNGLFTIFNNEIIDLLKTTKVFEEE